MGNLCAKNQVQRRLSDERRNQNRFGENSASAYLQQTVSRVHHCQSSKSANGNQCVENESRQNNMMFRRFDRKELSKSWDPASKYCHQNNYSVEEEDDQEDEDKYEESAFANKPIYYYMPQQQSQMVSQPLQLKPQDKKFQNFYNNILPNSNTAYIEDRTHQQEEVDYEEGHPLEEYDDEVEEEEEEDEEEEDEEEDDDSSYPNYQGATVQYLKKNAKIISKGFNNYLHQPQAIGHHAQQILQLNQQQQMLSAAQIQRIKNENSKTAASTAEACEEDNEEEYEDEEEYAQSMENQFPSKIHQFQEDEINSHVKSLNNSHIGYFSHNNSGKISQSLPSSSHEDFQYGQPQDSSYHQRQILHRQSQQQQQQQHLQQLQKQQQYQQKYGQLEQQQQLYHQNQQSPQRQQQVNHKCQQQQQLKIQSTQPTNQFKNNSLHQSQNTLTGYNKLDKIHQKQGNIINSLNTASNYYQNGQQNLVPRGCKTPSTDDNSECFNGYNGINGSGSNSNGDNCINPKNAAAVEQSKVSIDRTSPPLPSKPKSESEKKYHSPPTSSYLHQNYHQTYLTQYKFLKDKHLDLEQILKKIYFEQFKYDDLKEYVFPALREVSSINSFFDILFNSIRLYAEEVKNKIHLQLKEVTMSCQEESEANQQKNLNKNQDIAYFEQILNKHFKRLQKPFLEITNQIYEQYSVVEEYSKQSEKIVHLYINHFIEKNRSIRFNCTDLHKRIFIFFVFNDVTISNYLEAKINFFRQKVVNGSRYDRCLSQLSNIDNILSKKSQYIPSEEHPINIEIYEKETCDEEDEDDDSQNMGDERYQLQQAMANSNINQKMLKKNKKNRNNSKKLIQQKFQSIQDGELVGDQSDLYYDQVSGSTQCGSGGSTGNLENVEVNKKKKKKKKKSNANATQQNGEEEDENQRGSAEKIKKEKKKGQGCPMSEELEQFQKRLEESFKNNKEQQKIQAIISDQWILRLKDRYAKLKIQLNK